MTSLSKNSTAKNSTAKNSTAKKSNAKFIHFGCWNYNACDITLLKNEIDFKFV